jgi:Leucine-rich repeat (LRR) protein
MWDTSLPLALKTSLFALAGSIPTELGKLINMQNLDLRINQLSGTPPFAHIAWFGSTSLPLALKTSSYALAGSIPTEFGELINLTYLSLGDNGLSGTPSLLILPGVVVRVYQLL